MSELYTEEGDPCSGGESRVSTATSGIFYSTAGCVNNLAME